MYALHGLAVHAIQGKVLLSSWFAKEPNVSNNNDLLVDFIVDSLSS